MKKILSAGVAMIIAVTSLQIAIAADFPDVPASHANYTAIHFLRDRGVINGYEDGTYKPERSVTRAEFLKIILLSSGHPVLSGDLDRGAFPDVASSAWYFGFVNRGLALGVISGYPDGTFKPDRTVSRVEALKIMLRANGITESVLPTSGTSYSDIPATAWFAPYARYAMTAHLFDGSQMYPNEMLNRGQVAEMVYRFYQYRPDLLPAAPVPTPSASSSPAPTSTSGPSPTPTASSPVPTVTPMVGFWMSGATLAISRTSYSGACPAWSPIIFTAHIVTNGRAGNLAYRWERSDGQVTDYQVTGVVNGQTSTIITFAPNWDASVHSAYRLTVMNNYDATNIFHTDYLDFAVDCTSGATTPTPTASSSLVVLSANLSPSGTLDYNAPCPSSITEYFKGYIATNGAAGTISYQFVRADGTASATYTHTMTSGQTILGSDEIDYRLSLGAVTTNMTGSVYLRILAPNALVSGSIPYTLHCGADYLPATFRVVSGSFTAQQPGVRDGTWVCGATNNFTLAGRLTMATPASSGRIAYNWLFNTGASSPTMTIDFDPAAGSSIRLPDFIWSIPSSADPAHYTAWLNVLTPNGLVSSPWSIDKPRCGTL